MKSSFRPFMLFTVVAVFALVPAALRAAEEHDSENGEKPAVASVRPSGKVKSTDLPALAKITFEQAMKIATAALPGSIIKAGLEVEDGNLMYSFEIVDARKRVMEVEIDAGDGKVLDIDED